MKYPCEVKVATFLSRPNRFIAQVVVDGCEHTVHVKNTGRCRELLIPGVTVYLAKSDNPARKTGYDLIAVEKIRVGNAPLLINMDSQVVNDVTEEWLKKGLLFSKGATVRREVTWGNSRFDFYIEDGERRAFLEVKGVTLEQNGIARFPDAPTERGIKHLRELVACMQQGYEAYVLFVIQMKEIQCFSPNDAMHLAFGNTLREAVNQGVHALAFDCVVSPNRIEIDQKIEMDLF